MDDDERARLHDEADRARFEIRRQDERLEDQERELEREGEAFEEDKARAERAIRDELRREHWGQEP